ncbi:hypothetical protein [Peribacillus muralis]|uniref:hypothetical protein n=1 Tax=Peribacillus muralis TaxID=264697 RepID=UPI00349E7A29
MKDTGFYVPKSKNDRLPPAYTSDPQTGELDTANPQCSMQARWAALNRRRLSRYLQMLLNQGVHGNKRILSRPAVQLMTTNRLTAEQQAFRDDLAKNNVHLSHGQGLHGGVYLSRGLRVHRPVRLGRRSRHHGVR